MTFSERSTVSHRADSNRPPLPPARLAGGVAGMAADLLALAELQWELFRLDAGAATRRSVVAVGLIVAGAVFALSALPVLLVAVGYALMLAGLYGWAAFGVAFLVGLLLGGGLAWWGFKRLGAALGAFGRSSSEFSRNLAFVKQSLSGEPPASQIAASGPLANPAGVPDPLHRSPR